MYYDFIYYKEESDILFPERGIYKKIKCKRLTTALNRMVRFMDQRQYFGIDHEAQILDKNGVGSGEYINLHNINHSINKFII